MFYDITIRLQKHDYTLSNFYGDWLVADIKLKKWCINSLQTDLCVKLLEALDKRKSDLIDNRAMLCSVYLDPRYKMNLSMEQILLVKILLWDMWTEVKNLKSSESSDLVGDGENSLSNKSNDEEDCLEAYFRERCGHIEQTENIVNESLNVSFSPRYTMNKIEFLKVMDNYETTIKRLHHSESILKFWEDSKNIYPELYEVASVFLGIPPTQATVERTFSALGFVFSNRRHNLSQQVLENILLIKLNRDIAEDIFKEEMIELEALNNEQN